MSPLRRGIGFRAILSGTGHCVPAAILTNAELERRVSTTDAWIVERTGIRERRLAAPGEKASALALVAAQRSGVYARARETQAIVRRFGGGLDLLKGLAPHPAAGGGGRSGGSGAYGSASASPGGGGGGGGGPWRFLLSSPLPSCCCCRSSDGVVSPG